MRIFLSYSRSDRENRKAADLVDAALRAAGHKTFLDRRDLPLGEEFNARIRRSIQNAELFVFLASRESLRPGCYSMIELEWALRKWKDPVGRVLTVTLGIEAGRLPAALKPLTFLPWEEGTAEARVVGWAEERAIGTADGAGILSARDRLEQWARLAQPPLRKGRRKLPTRAFLSLFFGAGFIVANLAFAPAGGLRGEPIDSVFLLAASVAFAFLGLGIVVYSIVQLYQGLRGATKAVAVLVLDRSTSRNSVTLHLQTLDHGRISVEPVGSLQRRVYAGDYGWAWIRGRLLLDFVSGETDEGR